MYCSPLLSRGFVACGSRIIGDVSASLNMTYYSVILSLSKNRLASRLQPTCVTDRM